MNALSAGKYPQPIGLYVHIPFCETKCPYCDFNTYAGIEPLIPEYVEALRRETGAWGRILGHPQVATVFFGGGTPSYLSSEHIASLMDSVREAFDVRGVTEVTLEANPGDLTPQKVADYLGAGIDRLSIGVQSLDDKLLTILGRRHSADEAIRAYHTATQAGFDNVSIDLMYGIPQQGLDDWERTLSLATELAPKHVSMYCLTLEPGTPMEQSMRSGQMPEPDPDLAADMYVAAEEAMAARGYRHYEISNWALPGKESRHNLTYWRNQHYLGVGPGAHSYLAGHRFHNIRSPREYTRRLQTDGPETFPTGGLDVESIQQVPAVEGAETIDRRLEMAETMMLGLRLDTGIVVEEFVGRFGVPPVDPYRDTLTELESAGLLEASDGSIRLTSRGCLLGNEVFSRFFAPEGATV